MVCTSAASEFHLAVTVLVLLVGRFVAALTASQVRVVDATSSRLWAASEMSAREPVARPATPLASVMAALAPIDQRAACSLRLSIGWSARLILAFPYAQARS